MILKRFKLSLILLSFCALQNLSLKADEGMWIPMLLEQLNEDEMIDMGLELTAEDIYSINKSSLKDAIVHFGGGCTAEMISDQGLMLTNHHCGYGQIQSHSSVEHDYLKDGFWAMNRSEELTNEGLTASFIKRMADVSEACLEGVNDDMSEKERAEVIGKNIKSIIEKETEGTHYEAKIKPFFKGNQYYLFIIETFTDVRLVGAPPSSIGKYGADTDNWVWPRHTGDFSIFRIYANSENKPADYSPDNVPYKPAHSLPISIGGVKEGDFTMVFGFPGRTNSYLPSDEIQQTIEVLNPAKIKIRKTVLDLMDSKMRQSQKVKIQYAAKQSSISNGYKKWIGESVGLKETKALDKKRQYEAEFTLFAKGTKDFSKYKDLLPQFKALYDKREALALARRYFIETAIVNVSSMNYGFSLYRMSGQLADVEKQQEAIDRLKKSYEGHFKNLDTPLDKSILAAVLKLNVNELEKGQYPELYDDITAKSLDKIYSKSALVNKDIMEKILNMSAKKASKKLLKDPLFALVKAHADFYYQEIANPYSEIQDEIDRLMRDYMKAQMEVFSGKRFYPDANSTMRLSYGKVEGMNPKDALHYTHQTYLDGVMSKYIPGDYEYDLPEKLIELYKTKDYGNYADVNGKMPVCFIASNHTTGGNSGSPAINGKGQLIGLNFDRAWEGTMSDLNYDLSRCRNIMVDARYILFIVDKYAGASHLIEEMEIID